MRFTVTNSLTTSVIFLIAVGAVAQTSGKTSSTTTAATAKHNAVSNTALPKSIPPVKGVPKIAYSLKYIDVVVGKGELATPEKLYTINYTVWLRKDGTEIDSSIPDKAHPQRKPYSFAQGFRGIIPGLDTAFEGMRVGGKRRVFVPYELAYGEVAHPAPPGMPAIPAKSDLVFDMELISISELPKRPAQPMRPNMTPQTTKPGPPSGAGALPHPTTPGTPTAPTAPGTPTAPAATTTPTAPTTPAAPNTPAAPPSTAPSHP